MRINHGTTVMSNLTFIATLLSRADLRVRTWPSTSWMARSTVALEFESPTAQNSIPVPKSVTLHLATALATSAAAGSWSLFMTIFSLRRPTVSKSSATWSSTHASEAPLCSTWYPHALMQAFLHHEHRHRLRILSRLISL